jgi:hypothetical protein
MGNPFFVCREEEKMDREREELDKWPRGDPR